MLISPEYRKQQEALHQNPQYGTLGRQFGEMISGIVDRLEIDHLLDYGAGHNKSLTDTLRPERDLKYQAYDPGVPELAGDPVPAQMVCCIDVLEHIEPDCLDDVLDHLEELTELILFATVCTGPAFKVLPDGRNAHLIQEPMQWWLNKIWERGFTIQTVQMTQPNHFFFIAQAPSIELEA